LRELAWLNGKAVVLSLSPFVKLTETDLLFFNKLRNLSWRGQVSSTRPELNEADLLSILKLIEEGNSASGGWPRRLIER
jgi:hypothetical protein